MPKWSQNAPQNRPKSSENQVKNSKKNIKNSRFFDVIFGAGVWVLGAEHAARHRKLLAVDPQRLRTRILYTGETGGLVATTLISPRRATGPQKDMQMKAPPPLLAAPAVYGLLYDELAQSAAEASALLSHGTPGCGAAAAAAAAAA